ncbi:hypothetical protein [Kribbella sp. VKM Ac-2568]|uniref:hypothetical protein n=1 Tax=Kribbella sp. VKM Ac-2568 TaxID=2512219 RepID=UPI0010E1E87F|nr:hypothetical protein [Kribbella sp. VKM Ac-2568]TCM33814.1 hypothetical protein EV648_1282 [Kribbella sp. VKM Ac-2568]
MTESGGSGTPHWVRSLATIGSPIALATALLFYFGWVRTRFQARALGYDPAILQLSVQDYLLKSVNVLFLPFVVLVLVVLVLHHQHRRLVAAARRSDRVRASASRAGRLLVWSWPIWLLTAGVMLALPATRFIAVPISLSIGLLLALYGSTLTRTVGSGASWPRPTSIIVYVLLAFAIFWDTERIARATGEAFAQDILVYPWQLIAVTVYSEKRLELAVPGVTESELRPDSAYHFRYTGLRLLEGSHDRYVLLGANGGNIVVLKDEQGLRFEFSR